MAVQGGAVRTPDRSTRPFEERVFPLFFSPCSVPRRATETRTPVRSLSAPIRAPPDEDTVPSSHPRQRLAHVIAMWVVSGAVAMHMNAHFRVESKHAARAPQLFLSSMRVQGSRTVRGHGLTDRTGQVGARGNGGDVGQERTVTSQFADGRARRDGSDGWA